MWNGLESKSPDSSLNQKTQSSPKEWAAQDIKSALPLVMKGDLSLEERALLAKFRTDVSFAAKVRGDIKETNEYWKIGIGQEISWKLIPELWTVWKNEKLKVKNIEESNLLWRTILVITTNYDDFTIYRDPQTLKRVEMLSGRYLAGTFGARFHDIYSLNGKQYYPVMLTNSSLPTIQKGLEENEVVYLDPSGKEIKFFIKWTSEYIKKQWETRYSDGLEVITNTGGKMVVDSSSLEPLKVNGKQIISIQDTITLYPSLPWLKVKLEGMQDYVDILIVGKNKFEIPKK